VHKEVDTHYLLRAMSEKDNNKTEAAKLIGLERKTFSNRLDKLDRRT
jgi:DNA-binding NtrC family response regulator